MEYGTVLWMEKSETSLPYKVLGQLVNCKHSSQWEQNKNYESWPMLTYRRKAQKSNKSEQAKVGEPEMSYLSTEYRITRTVKRWKQSCRVSLE